MVQMGHWVSDAYTTFRDHISWHMFSSLAISRDGPSFDTYKAMIAVSQFGLDVREREN